MFKLFNKNILLSLIGLTLVFIVSGCDSIFGSKVAVANSHKSDSDLTAHFQAHKAEFNRLIEMLKEDRDIVEIELIFYEKYNLSKERVGEYKNLISKLDVPTAITVYRNQDKEISSVSFPLSITRNEEGEGRYWSIEKLFIWTNKKPDEKRGNKTYLELEENWYLLQKTSAD